jgi:glycosyltransferase involved in cell wall biosynthesis
VPEARFVIAGTGEDFGRYRQMMVHPDRFTVYNEYVSDEMRARLFREASVVALPYVDATQSGVVTVAYTYGKPAVATTVGGLPEVIDNGITGLLVPPRDEQAMAEAIIRLLRDPAARRAMGAAGRRKLEQEWSAQAVAARTLEVYRSAIESKGRPLAMGERKRAQPSAG